MNFPRLLRDIQACTHCKKHLPHGPRPVLQAHPAARLRIIGQAPGHKVHETGVPWNDKSGERLWRWLGLSHEIFYDAQKVALIPMGFCYPGKAPSGDLPPRPECAPLWHARLDKHLSSIGLTLLIGQYAQNHYLGDLCKKTLGETVKAWAEYAPMGYLPLAHPSPRNQIWLQRNPWFENELIPEIRKRIKKLDL